MENSATEGSVTENFGAVDIPYGIDGYAIGESAAGVDPESPHIDSYSVTVSFGDNFTSSASWYELQGWFIRSS